MDATATYLHKISEHTAKQLAPYAGDYCPECANFRPDGWGGGHIDVTLADGTTALAIGCEGYWVINPTRLGLPKGNWCDWTRL